VTIGESFVFNGRTVTVLAVERDEFTDEIVLIMLRIGGRTAVFMGGAIDQVLAARAASLPGRLS
jgi:hypothetical protein